MLCLCSRFLACGGAITTSGRAFSDGTAITDGVKNVQAMNRRTPLYQNYAIYAKPCHLSTVSLTLEVESAPFIFSLSKFCSRSARTTRLLASFVHVLHAAASALHLLLLDIVNTVVPAPRCRIVLYHLWASFASHYCTPHDALQVEHT